MVSICEREPAHGPAGEGRMSGQLVLAELEAFQGVIVKAVAGDGEKVKLWSRSTIANALHRLGPWGGMKEAADRAWQDADAFAASLDVHDSEDMRQRALTSLDDLLATVRRVKAAMPVHAER
jgi:hypothetical protein